MLSLGGERLPPPPKKKKKKKALDHYLHHDLGMPPLLWCFSAHLLILEYPDHHQNLISSSLYYPGPLHKISSQSVHNFLCNVVHRQTDRQTDKQTNATKNITSFAKEVIKKGSGSLPAPRSGYAKTIMVFFCSFTHLTIPRSPPKFNQFFLVLLRTPP